MSALFVSIGPGRFVLFGLLAALPACTATGAGDSQDMASPAPPPDLGMPGLALPGATFYPSSVSAAADGTIYVGSLATGQVTRFAPGSTAPLEFIAAGDPKGVIGVFVDSNNATLYLCATDFSTTPRGSEVRAYDLTTAALRKKYPFSAEAFCLDFAMDGAGVLYVTDGNGRIWTLAKGGDALAVWTSGPLFHASTGSGVGAKGIAVDGQNVYVTAFSDNRLVRVPITADGTAGAAQQIPVAPALRGPDTLRRDGAGTLVVVEGAAGQLSRLTVTDSTATATPVGTRLNGPTSVIRVGGTYWVSEGQLDRFFDTSLGAPTLPFRVRSIAAP